MCIAILNTKNQISKETLLTCWEANPDGGGMLYVTDKGLQTFKEMNSFKRFFAEYSKQRKANPDSNFVLHFRIATSGKIDLNNCHPFAVNKSLSFVHNGMLSINPLNKAVSDTWTFNETILKKLPRDFYKNESYVRLLDMAVGSSKLVFLDSDNTPLIINEAAGHWKGDNWYSNNSYMPYVPYKGITDHYEPKKLTDWYNSKNYDFCQCCHKYDLVTYHEDWQLQVCNECISMYAI